MVTLDDYTDEELGRMFRAAMREMTFFERERVTTREAFVSFLTSIGLGLIADVVKMSVWAWERVNRIWHRIFG